MAPKGGIDWKQVVVDLGNRWSMHHVKKRWGEVSENEQEKQSVGHDSVEDGGEYGGEYGDEEDREGKEEMAQMVKRVAELERQNKKLKKNYAGGSEQDHELEDGAATKRQKRKERKEKKTKLKSTKTTKTTITTAAAVSPTSNMSLTFQQMEALHNNTERIIRLAAYDKAKAIKDQMVLLGMGKQW